MVEIYADPTHLDGLDGIRIALPYAIFFAFAGSVIVGILVVLAVRCLWPYRSAPVPELLEDKKDWSIMLTSGAFVMLIQCFAWLGNVPLPEEVDAARDADDQATAENRQDTEEQFADRYGELEFLSCADGSCQPVNEGLFEVIDGDHGTEDVAFRDEQGVLHEDAYLSREASSDPDVAATVKLMVRDDGHEAEEYDPEPSDEEAQ